MGTASSLQIRGTTVDAARRFLLRHEGHPGWSQFLEELTPEQRYLTEGNVRPRHWYPLVDYIGVLDIAAKHIAADSAKQFMTDLGHFVMDDGVTSLYKAFFRIVSPSFVIRLSALFWFQFFKGSRLRVTGRGKKWVHAAVVDSVICTETMCHTVKGGMISALEHGGARDVKVDHHSCRSISGDDRCEFHFSWV
jgi:hypothetical protein